MLHSVWRMRRYAIQATDGRIGHINDAYFDDMTWAVHYVVVGTGGWLSGRNVLLSPAALDGINHEARCIRVVLTREYVANAPDADSQLPVTRRWEAKYHDYFGWPYYWDSSGFPGVSPYPAFSPENMEIVEEQEEEERKSEIEQKRKEKEKEENIHLQSVRDVGGSCVAATDGDIGRVIDYIIDSNGWVIRYLQVDTGNWLPGKKVLLPTRLISRVHWERGALQIPLTREEIKNAPMFDPDRPIERDYEEKIFDYYRGCPQVSGLYPYWHQNL